MSYLSNPARFDGAQRALTEDELRKYAPSVFAVTAHESRSDRFSVIPTIEVIRALSREGFEVVGAEQSRCRQPGRADFTKHMLRIRQLRSGLQVGDTVFEMKLKNANDGTCQYDLFSALFRIACLNSMVAMTSELSSVKVRHSGDVIGKVIEGTYQVIQDGQAALEAPDKWSRIQLQPEEQSIFAEQAHMLRFADNEGKVTTAIKPAQLLHARRSEDDGNDLWRTFNRVQENVIRGGQTAWGTDANNHRRRFTARPIKGIDQDVKLNRALFTLAAKMAELKA